MRLSDQQRLDWLRLIRSENVGPATFRDLINHFGTAARALEELPEFAIRARHGKQIRIATQAAAERELDALHRFGGRIVALGEPDYPAALRTIDAAPPLISVIGNVAAFQRNFVAIVGSRNASIAGIKFTHLLARGLAEADFATVSGLARGIDTAAHKATVETGTVAVLAGGIDQTYPPENADLLKQIWSGPGAAISEMPFGWSPQARDFPKRNRLIAGMSLGLAVVEASQRSGSLISARLANEMGRLVFAVPGSPLDPRSAGTNQLIRDGATLITGAPDVVEAIRPLIDMPMYQEEFRLEENDRFDPEQDEPPIEDERATIINALGPTPTDVDDIIRLTGISPARVQVILLELDIAGRLERHGRNLVSLIG
ncbi:MAG: DNA-processing protein DprA [Pseudomonadota bacterium]